MPLTNTEGTGYDIPVRVVFYQVKPSKFNDFATNSNSRYVDADVRPQQPQAHGYPACLSLRSLNMVSGMEAHQAIVAIKGTWCSWLSRPLSIRGGMYI